MKQSLPLPNPKLSSILLFLLFMLSTSAWANNLNISNVRLERFPADDYALIHFDISWENSWRINAGPANWDAVWLFAKYRKRETPTTAWSHATLNWVDGTGAADGHIVPTGGLIESSEDNGNGGSHGAFIFSADEGMGLVSQVDYTGGALRWDYTEDGLADGDSVEICLIGIEMVYVPEGEFQVGGLSTNDPSDCNFHAYNASDPDDETVVFTITSENAITVSEAEGSLWYDCIGDQGNIPIDFPKGFAGFYCMKYEITQGQYVDFLNRLDATSALNRVNLGNTGNFRYEITGSPGNYSTTNPYVARNYLIWADLAAYLDWAALRPMTELEYEKACRGTQSAVANEYAWGTTNITGADVLVNAGQDDEHDQGNDANAVYGGNLNVNGPMRVGASGQGVNTREGTGATYYGIMEMSGNLWERAITVGHPEGRAFRGAHGDGELASGDANVANWPGGYSGVGFRGGSWRYGANDLRVSVRNIFAITDLFPSPDNGGRGSRSSAGVSP